MLCLPGKNCRILLIICILGSAFYLNLNSESNIHCMSRTDWKRALNRLRWLHVITDISTDIFGRIFSGLCKFALTLSDPTSDLVRQYDFLVSLRCRKTSDTVFVAFARLLSEHVRRFSSCSTGFSQQIAQVVLFLSLCFSLLKL
jgi:hypothetical protein